MRSFFAALIALIISAAVPPISGLLFAVSARPTEDGEYLTPEESIILIYSASIFLGAVVGMPSFFILRRTLLSSAWRLTLAALVLGTVTVVLLWFGTTGPRLNLLWTLPPTRRLSSLAWFGVCAVSACAGLLDKFLRRPVEFRPRRSTA